MPSEMSIRHFAEGRMKCQAFVAFPTDEAAERVLDKVHGVVLQGKPLVVVRLRLAVTLTDQPVDSLLACSLPPVLSQAAVIVRIDGDKSAAVGKRQRGTKRKRTSFPLHMALFIVDK